VTDGEDDGEVQLRWAAGPGDLAGALELRERVFCGEQGVPREEEIDGRDADALHLVALGGAEGQVIGTLRLLFDGPRVKVGRVAVERRWRGREIASRMLELALQAARERGCEEARLAAQLTATGVYRRAGFEVQSGVFQEAGIDHVWMGQKLVQDD
jgi:predicted GNAT family N-acyltransferase